MTASPGSTTNDPSGDDGAAVVLFLLSASSAAARIVRPLRPSVRHPSTRHGVAPLLLAGAVLVGCSSSTELLEMQQQLDVMQRQIVTIQQQSSDRGQIEELEVTLAEMQELLLRNRADASANVDLLLDRIDSLRADVQQNRVALSDLASEVENVRLTMEDLQATVNRPAPRQGTTTPTLEPSALYESAYQNFLSADYRTALVGFRTYVERSPDSDSADNALYWMGECYFNLAEYREAIREFTAVRQRYPASEKVPSALLRAGLAHLRLNQLTEARHVFRSVMADYPRSDEAILAQRQLENLAS